MKTKLTLALAAALGTSSAFAETKALDPHVHGIANLQLVQEGADLVITLDSPSASLLGFEHAPQTEAQHTAVDQLTVQLESFDGAMMINADAACDLVDADVAVLAEMDHDEQKHSDEHHDDENHGEHKHSDEHHDDENHDEHKHGDEHHDDEHHDEHKHGDEHHDDEHHDHDNHGDEGAVHSEVTASWTLTCAAPDKLASLTVLLFDGNAFLETVSAEMLLESGPRVQALTPDATVLDLQ